MQLERIKMNKSADAVLIVPPSPYPGMSMLFPSLTTTDPLGIGYLISYLKKKGINKVYGLNLYNGLKNINRFSEYIKRKKTKVVGFSTMTENYNNGIRLARIVKNILPSTTVVMGGPHVTFTDEETLLESCVDVVVRHEGEITFYELLDCILGGRCDLSKVDGITYKENNQIVKNKHRNFIKNLDVLPFPERNLPDIDGILMKLKEITPSRNVVITTRGCPGGCKFCAATAMSGGTYRMRSVEDVIEECNYISSLSKNNEIFFGDDTITANVGRLMTLLKYLRKGKIKWAAESRVDVITPELAKEIVKAGCIGLQFGVESGDQRVLDRMGKGITLVQVENAIKYVIDAGLNPVSVACSFMIGIPGDTRKSVKKTLKFIKYLQDKYGIAAVIGITVPYPGTYIWRFPEKSGILRIVEQSYERFSVDNPVMDLENLTHEEIRALYYDYVVESIHHPTRYQKSLFQHFHKRKGNYYGEIQKIYFE